MKDDDGDVGESDTNIPVLYEPYNTRIELDVDDDEDSGADNELTKPCCHCCTVGHCLACCLKHRAFFAVAVPFSIGVGLLYAGILYLCVVYVKPKGD